MGEAEARKLVQQLRAEPIVAEFNRLLSGNKIFIERLAGVAVVSKEDALSYNLVGPNLRGSGIKWDIRRDIPYSVYPELEFDVPVGTAMGIIARNWKSPRPARKPRVFCTR